MPRSVRRSLRRRDQDDDLPESWAAKHKQHKKQHDVFPDPERDAIDKRVRVETALHLFAKRYPNVARTNAAYAERYVMEACDICATLLPIRFCVVVNHFHNVFRSTKVAHNLTFDQYLNDIVKGHQCSGVQDLLRFPAARDLCHEADYEDDGLEQSLVPRKRRNRTRLFTPPQRDNTMSVLNRVFYDVLFDPLLALGPAISLTEAVVSAKLAGALFFFCDEEFIFGMAGGCDGRSYHRPEEMMNSVEHRVLYDFAPFFAKRMYHKPPSTRKDGRKKNPELEAWYAMDDEQRKFVQERTVLAELADNYYRPVVELIVKWLEEQRLEMDVSGNKMAAVVATCLTHMLNQLNRTMTVYNVDFVAAFEFFLARSVHPLWMESLPDLSYFRRDDMNVIYFVQVHLHKYPKFAFLWNKKGVDETTAGMVNFLLLFALDLLLNILLIVLRLVLRLRQQTEVQELSLNYALYFVCSLSSSTSPLALEHMFELLGKTTNSD